MLVHRMNSPDSPPRSFRPGVVGSLKSTENIREDGQTHCISEERMECLDDELVEQPVSQTRIELLRSLKSKTKEKMKQLLGVTDAKTVGDTLHESDDITDQITGDPAFNPGVIENQRRRSKRERAKATLDSVSSFATGLSSPKNAIKGKATRTTAGKLSKVERPYLSHDADIEFLEASDNLSRAEPSLSSGQVTSDEDLKDLIGGHRAKLNEMRAHRESLRLSHATSRHVNRVRVVPKRHLDFPKWEAFFRSHGEGGTFNKYDWLKWIGHVLVWYVPSGVFPFLCGLLSSGCIPRANGGVKLSRHVAAQ